MAEYDPYNIKLSLVGGGEHALDTLRAKAEGVSWKHPDDLTAPPITFWYDDNSDEKFEVMMSSDDFKHVVTAAIGSITLPGGYNRDPGFDDVYDGLDLDF